MNPSNFMSMFSQVGSLDAGAGAIASPGAALSGQQAQTTAQLSAMLTQASQSLTCGPDCQKAKTNASLAQKLEDAKVNIQTAPSQLEQAQKNYYTATQGVAGYKAFQTDTLTKDADAKVAEMTTAFNTNFGECNELNNLLKTNAQNYQNSLELYQNYKDKNAKMLKEVDSNINDITTSDRKTYYETQNTDLLLYWHSWFFWIYVALYVVLVLALFLSPNLLSLGKRIVVIIVFLLLPFVLTPAFYYVAKLVHGFGTLMPKNVYTTL
jgi:hypothetical protein